MRLTLSVFLFKPIEDVTTCTQCGHPLFSHQYDDCDSLKIILLKYSSLYASKMSLCGWLMHFQTTMELYATEE